MSIVSAKDILVEAAKGRYAIGAFSITNLVQLEGLVDAAVENRSPVIIQTSAQTAAFLGADVLAAVFRTIAGAAPVPMGLELDRCSDLSYGMKCAGRRYTSIAFDASDQPLDQNIRQTCELVEHCHKVGGVSVEAKLALAGKDLEAQAVQFAGMTGIDVLGAPSNADVKQLAAIHDCLDEHGLRVPLAIQANTQLSGKALKMFTEAGAAKFNVCAPLNHTLIDAQVDYLAANRQEYQPARIDIAIRDAIRKVVGQWMQVLGSVGKA